MLVEEDDADRESFDAPRRYRERVAAETVASPPGSTSR